MPVMWRDVLRKLGSLAAPPAGPEVRADGRVWHLSAEGAALFGPAGPAYERWLADGSAEVVKHGPHRTVYRVALATGAVYVKHCRISGPRAWAREVIRAPKARLEFENAARLRALGVGAAVPLAWGAPDTRWPGESFLVTRDLAPAVPFTAFVESRLPAFGPDRQSHVRRQLARGLGRFLALLHDRGVTHPDPHPGNLLVELPGSLMPHFSLLDVHAVRFGPPLRWGESLANLVRYNRWFQMRAGATDRLRFWRTYRLARQSLPVVSPEEAGREAAELERATRASNRRFWLARTARYKGTHRTVRRVRAGRVRGLAVRDLPDDFLRRLLADPDAAFAAPGTKLLKRCVSSTVAEMEMPTPAGPRAVVLKRVTVRSALDAVKNLVRSSAVRRSWLLGHGLCERGLPTPRPLAMFHRHSAGVFPAAGYLLTEKVPDAVGLSEAVRTCRDPRVLRRWAERLARVVRAMHDRGVSHRDLKAPNVMLQGAAADPAAATPVLIDLVGASASADAVPFARRARELARLNASFLTVPHVTRGERLRFLRAYLRAGAREPDWKKWWKAVSAATAAKVAKNRRSGRALG
jgi:tRNA A-37 threonylcarbamoyl transferase component Bud32